MKDLAKIDYSKYRHSEILAVFHKYFPLIKDIVPYTPSTNPSNPKTYATEYTHRVAQAMDCMADNIVNATTAFTTKDYSAWEAISFLSALKGWKAPFTTCIPILNAGQNAFPIPNLIEKQNGTKIFQDTRIFKLAILHFLFLNAIQKTDSNNAEDFLKLLGTERPPLENAPAQLKSDLIEYIEYFPKERLYEVQPLLNWVKELANSSTPKSPSSDLLNELIEDLQTAHDFQLEQSQEVQTTLTDETLVSSSDVITGVQANVEPIERLAKQRDLEKRNTSAQFVSTALLAVHGNRYIKKFKEKHPELAKKERNKNAIADAQQRYDNTNKYYYEIDTLIGVSTRRNEKNSRSLRNKRTILELLKKAYEKPVTINDLSEELDKQFNEFGYQIKLATLFINDSVNNSCSTAFSILMAIAKSNQNPTLLSLISSVVFQENYGVFDNKDNFDAAINLISDRPDNEMNACKAWLKDQTLIERETIQKIFSSTSERFSQEESLGTSQLNYLIHLGTIGYDLNEIEKYQANFNLTNLRLADLTIQIAEAQNQLRNRYEKNPDFAKQAVDYNKNLISKINKDIKELESKVTQLIEQNILFKNKLKKIELAFTDIRSKATQNTRSVDDLSTTEIDEIIKQSEIDEIIKRLEEKAVSLKREHEQYEDQVFEDNETREDSALTLCSKKYGRKTTLYNNKIKKLQEDTNSGKLTTESSSSIITELQNKIALIPDQRTNEENAIEQQYSNNIQNEIHWDLSSKLQALKRDLEQFQTETTQWDDLVSLKLLLTQTLEIQEDYKKQENSWINELQRRATDVNNVLATLPNHSSRNFNQIVEQYKRRTDSVSLVVDASIEEQYNTTFTTLNDHATKTEDALLKRVASFGLIELPENPMNYELEALKLTIGEGNKAFLLYNNNFYLFNGKTTPTELKVPAKIIADCEALQSKVSKAYTETNDTNALKTMSSLYHQFLKTKKLSDTKSFSSIELQESMLYETFDKLQNDLSIINSTITEQYQKSDELHKKIKTRFKYYNNKAENEAAYTNNPVLKAISQASTLATESIHQATDLSTQASSTIWRTVKSCANYSGGAARKSPMATVGFLLGVAMIAVALGVITRNPHFAQIATYFAQHAIHIQATLYTGVGVAVACGAWSIFRKNRDNDAPRQMTTTSDASLSNCSV